MTMRLVRALDGVNALSSIGSMAQEIGLSTATEVVLLWEDPCDPAFSAVILFGSYVLY